MTKIGTKSGERIAKFIARAGVCSRRAAEELIAAGRVAVNGAVIDSPALNISTADEVRVDGKKLADRAPPALWRFHKPAGTLTSNTDAAGRATIFDVLPVNLPRVITVGRLDYTTEGLLLLTNDGDLARWLEHPNTGLERRYRVRVFGEVTNHLITSLKRGVVIDGVQYRPALVRLESTEKAGANSWLEVTLTEGKNREVKKLLGHFGLKVTRLIRTAYGPFQLGKLAKGGVEAVPQRALQTTLADYFDAHH